MAKLGAATVADILVLTNLALRMRQGFLRSETVPPGTARDLRPRIQHHVTQFPAALDEKIARINVAIIFHHYVAVAGFVQGAGAGLLAGECFRHIVEKADADLAPLRPPHVEDFAQETAVLFRSNRKGQGLTVAVELGQRNELQVFDPETAIKPVQFLRLADIRLAQDAENVERSEEHTSELQ